MTKFISNIIVVMICFSLVSCRSDTIPRYSKNFDRDFVDAFEDNYIFCDPQLAYFTASPYEVKLESKKDDVDTLYLSVIDDVDKEFFVACTAIEIRYNGPSSYYNRVYQHSNAPIVMDEWKISKVSLIASTAPHTSSDTTSTNASSRAEGFIKEFLEASSTLGTFDTSTSLGVLKAIKDAYQNRIFYKNGQADSPSGIRTQDDVWGAVFYSILIQFEENSNIVWNTYLCELEDGVYFECFSYENGTIKREYARLDDDFAATVRKLIDDYSKGSPNVKAT